MGSFCRISKSDLRNLKKSKEEFNIVIKGDDYMKITQIRNATLIIEYNNTILSIEKGNSTLGCRISELTAVSKPGI